MTATYTYEAEQRMVLGANTYRTFAQVLTPVFEKVGRDPWVARMMDLPATVVSNSLVDRVQVTLFPVITGRTDGLPVFRDAAGFDLDLLESRTLDGNIRELIYRPTLHA